MTATYRENYCQTEKHHFWDRKNELLSRENEIYAAAIQNLHTEYSLNGYLRVYLKIEGYVSIEDAKHIVKNIRMLASKQRKNEKETENYMH